MKQPEELPDHKQDLFAQSFTGLRGFQLEIIREQLPKNADGFSIGDLDFGRTYLVEHRIETGNREPVRQACRLEVEKVMENLRQGSNSSWTSAVVLKWKKDGSLMCCVDFFALNDTTVRIDETLDRVL